MYHDRPRVVFGPLASGTFRRRLNRFVAEVEGSSGETLAHVANSGRLAELLVAGARVWMVPKAAPGRRTQWDLTLVEAGECLVCIDTRRANELVAVAVAQQAFSSLAKYPSFRREVRILTSRFDFLLQGGTDRCVLEVKCVTLVSDGVGRFPDAPTTRGARHLRELTELAREGHGSAVLFLVQRQDAEAFAPNEVTDLPFTAALRGAAEAGVLVLAYRCRVSVAEMALGEELPVLL